MFLVMKVMVGQNLNDKENLEVGGVSWKVYCLRSEQGISECKECPPSS